MWTDRLTPLRMLLRGLFIPLVIAALVPTLLCINPLGRSLRIGHTSLEERMIGWWSSCVCRVFGVRVRVRGEPAAAPVLVVANHISWLDVQALHSAAAMGFVGKAEIGGWPLVGSLARAGDTIFIERGNHDSSAGVSSAIADRLKEGRRVAIFPEGGIRPGEGVRVFHARLFKAAVDSDCPIQPVMIRYLRNGRRDRDMTFINQETQLRNMMRLLGRPSCVADIRFLEPFRAGGKPRRDLANAARAAVAAAYDEQP